MSYRDRGTSRDLGCNNVPYAIRPPPVDFSFAWLNMSFHDALREGCPERIMYSTGYTVVTRGKEEKA